MQTPVNRIRTGLALFFATFAIAVAGYMIAGAGFVDALYMVVITIFSVGYEESVPIDSTGLKAFTIVVILLGCTSLLYVSGGFIQMVMEGELTRSLDNRRKTQRIEELRGHAIICGFGRMGQILAQELSTARFPFVILEKDAARREMAEQRGYLVLEGDAAEEETLTKAGIADARFLATVLPNDAVNVFITLSARDMNPKLAILARGEVPATERKLTQAGANHVVLPAAIGGLRLAHMIVRPTTTHLLDTLENTTMINDDLDLLGIHLSEVVVERGSQFQNRSVDFIEHKLEEAHLVVAIRRADGSLSRRPAGRDQVHLGDTVILIEHGSAERTAMEQSH